MTVELVGALLAVATLVAMATRRLKAPYTVGLVLAGGFIAWVPGSPHVELSKDLVFSAFLPPLLFEGARQLRWNDLRRDAVPIAVFATIGVAISAGAVAFGAQRLLGLSSGSAAVFGALISATDPVAILALFKGVGGDERVRMLVEAESLFNDASAAVLFSVAVGSIAGSTPSIASVGLSLGSTILIGVIVGSAIGGAAILIAGRSDDALLDATFTIASAYGSFLLAERLGGSGVLATLVTGILLGNFGSLGSFEDTQRASVDVVWETIAFLANSLLFLLMGLRLAHRSVLDAAPPIAIAAALSLVARAITVYPCSLAFARTRWRIPPDRQHVLVWGGLRGALAVGLALGLPAQFPERERLIDLTFGVVAFSIIVQGSTIGPFMRRILGPGAAAA